MPKAEDQITLKLVSMMKVLTAQPPRIPAPSATIPAAAPSNAERKAKLRRIRDRLAPERLEDRRLEGARLFARGGGADQDEETCEQRCGGAPARGGGDTLEQLRDAVDGIARRGSR